MGIVLCIPIARPRRIESSNQMRFCNIRPPRARVDFQPRPKRITTLAVARGEPIPGPKLKRTKKKKLEEEQMKIKSK